MRPRRARGGRRRRLEEKFTNRKPRFLPGPPGLDGRALFSRQDMSLTARAGRVIFAKQLELARPTDRREVPPHEVLPGVEEPAHLAGAHPLRGADPGPARVDAPGTP